MTLVGWLADRPGYVGGAELTQAQFREVAPDHVEVIDCLPGKVTQGCDAYVINNCMQYGPFELIFNKPTFKLWHDVGPHVPPMTWEALQKARHICVSPLQRERMGLDAEVVPPILPLEGFREAAESAQERRGAVAVGSWMGPGKAPDEAALWGKRQGVPVTFFGGGPFAPAGSIPLPYEQMPETLSRFETFVHLPRELEPCGRAVIEAWAAGCQVVTNSLVGARHWIMEAPEALETAGETFWDIVLDG